MKIFAWIAVAIVGFFTMMTFALSAALSGGTFGAQEAGAFPPGVDLNLDAEQMRNVVISLTVSDEVDAPPLAVMAMIVSGLGESEFRSVPNAQGSGYCGVFQAHPRNIDCDDTELQARSFLKGGLGFQAGGAIYLATNRSSLSPGTIATMVEASGQPGSFYDVHRARAERIISAWRSGGPGLATGSGKIGDLVSEANRMTSLHEPYVWGGGHLEFDEDGPWDCSGAVSQLMHHLGLLDGRPLTSGEFETQGLPGRGKIFTIYANSGHIFIVMEAGEHRGDSWGTATRDLEGAQGSGPLWHHHPTSGFVARHYQGW